MIKISFLSSNISNVRAIITVQPLNGLPGLASRTSNERITAPSGFFMRRVSTRHSMVGYVGAPKGAPGFSCLTGRPTLRSSPPKIGLVGGEFLNQTGVQP